MIPHVRHDTCVRNGVDSRQSSDGRWNCWHDISLIAAVVCALCATSVKVSRADDVDEGMAEERAIRSAVAHVAPSVVQIQPLGGLERVENRLNASGPTTGLIVDPDGWIVTSQYGVSGNPAGILVVLPDGQRLPARRVATDHSCELVLLKVDPLSPLPVPETVSPDSLAIGQWAIGVGRTYTAEQVNLSVGILSARDRGWGRALQTDAKISPANYGGPLIDIYGRVMGVLVPLEGPFGEGMGGLIWYDSGIGFAIPMATLQGNLPRWKQGEDLHPGELGIDLKGNDLYGSPPIIQQCLPVSPALQAGLESGDTILALDGVDVTNQAELRQQLGPHYAGETISLTVRRDEKQLALSATLVEDIPPYARPWLGILPQRDGAAEAAEGVVVRYVFEGSPAEQAGLEPGDRITRLQDAPIETAEQLRAAVISFQPDDVVQLAVAGGDAEREVEVTLREVNVEVPTDVPLPVTFAAEQATDVEGVGRQVFKLPEEAHECAIYAPATAAEGQLPGLLLVFSRPGDFDEETLVSAWRRHCDTRQVVLAAPKPEQSSGWSRSDLEFVKKALPEIIDRYRVDRNRVAVLGFEVGGRAAFFEALSLPEAVRGVVAIDAGLPDRLTLPRHLPSRPLAILLGLSEQSAVQDRVEEAAEQFREARYPVARWTVAGSRQLSSEEREAVARWLDALDRI